jgi:predicted N-formylglutamate amidohydrolase
LFEVTWSRLFVEANRAPHNPRIWSRFMKDLPKAEHESILERWWWPHRNAVAQAVTNATTSGHRVVHVAVHSFTPELDGRVRNAEVTFLYDSARKKEADFCHRWAAMLKRLNPELRVRFNYPYRGVADGLSTWLRHRHREGRYLGVELEFNQALVDAPGWPRFQKDVAASLRDLVPGV